MADIIESVRKGVELCKANGIDMVLAIGGGSVIDCAKVVAGGAKYGGDAWDLVIDPTKIKAALPIYSVLILAATGSEMDTFAVISDMAKNEKWGTGSPLFQPKMSVLDPTYTFTVSQMQTAAGTADMMSHTFENYFTSVEGFLQARFCEGVLKTCITVSSCAEQSGVVPQPCQAQDLFYFLFENRMRSVSGAPPPVLTSHGRRNEKGRYHRHRPPSEAIRRSDRSSVYPILRLLTAIVYHLLPLLSTAQNSIVLDTGSTLSLPPRL